MGRGIRSKPDKLSNGRTIGGGAFGVGALAYLLKNRFYIGEVVYRGEVHRGDHAPILDRPLFECRAGEACGPNCGAALPAARLARASEPGACLTIAATA